MVRFLLVLIIVVFHAACGVIVINEDNYRTLNAEELKFYKPYETENELKTGVETVYEINTNQIKERLKLNKYTWINCWLPYCKSDYCPALIYFEEVVDSLKPNSIDFLLISSTYDTYDIKKAVELSNFKRPVFVIENEFYKLNKVKKVRSQLIFDLTGDPQKAKEYYNYDNFFFYKDSLVYAGKLLNTSKIDSLLSHFKRERN